MDRLAGLRDLIDQEVCVFQDGVAEAYGEVRGISVEIYGDGDAQVRLRFDLDEYGEWVAATDTDLGTVTGLTDAGPFVVPYGENPIRFRWTDEPRPPLPPPPRRSRPSELAE